MGSRSGRRRSGGARWARPLARRPRSYGRRSTPSTGVSRATRSRRRPGPHARPSTAFCAPPRIRPPSREAAVHGGAGGPRLVRGAVDPDLPFARVPDVFRFVALGALLACIAAPTIGTSALCLSGLVAWRDYPVTWWTWWLGDTVGVILFAPLLVAVP